LKLATQTASFDGLSFEELARLLRDEPLGENEMNSIAWGERTAEIVSRVNEPRNGGELFDCLHEGLWRDEVLTWDGYPKGLRTLQLNGLISAREGRHSGRVYVQYQLTDSGRRFRNRMLMVGDRETRRRVLWSAEADKTERKSTSV
jgi:hypothetical protein